MTSTHEALPYDPNARGCLETRYGLEGQEALFLECINGAPDVPLSQVAILAPAMPRGVQ